MQATKALGHEEYKEIITRILCLRVFVAKSSIFKTIVSDLHSNYRQL